MINDFFINLIIPWTFVHLVPSRSRMIQNVSYFFSTFLVAWRVCLLLRCIFLLWASCIFFLFTNSCLRQSDFFIKSTNLISRTATQYLWMRNEPKCVVVFFVVVWFRISCNVTARYAYNDSLICCQIHLIRLF